MDDIEHMTLEQTRAAAQEILDGTTGDLAGADAERFHSLTRHAESCANVNASATLSWPNSSGLSAAVRRCLSRVARKATRTTPTTLRPRYSGVTVRCGFWIGQ